MSKERVIIHVDMDAFFAAIEQMDNPQYAGRPVVVGADPQGGRGRGVVSTCSYEARRYGIHSAQPISEAYRRCPDAVFLPVRGERYGEVSRRIREILREFTPLLEPISIDEAFLDVTDTHHLFGGKVETARRIRDEIERRTGLTASLGVAPNKMVAKIASDLEKPRGLVVVESGEVREFLHPLKVGRLWGVGEKTEEMLHALGIHTIGDLAKAGLETLRRKLGKHGQHLWDLACGRDDRPVETTEEVKSVGNEHTFDEDTDDEERISSRLMQLCEKVAHRLRTGGHRGRTVTTKVRLEGFETFTRSRTFDHPVDTAPEIYRVASANMRRVDRAGRKVRLIGVSVSGLEEGGRRQMNLFETAGPEGNVAAKWRRLAPTIDQIKERFGEGALRQGIGYSPHRDNEGLEEEEENEDAH